MTNLSTKFEVTSFVHSQDWGELKGSYDTPLGLVCHQ